MSVILPAYNEESRLQKTLYDVRSYLEQRGFNYEIIVVDDGSTDRTSNLVLQFLSQFSRPTHSVRLLRYEQNRGKGYAVRYGMQKADGKLLLL